MGPYNVLPASVYYVQEDRISPFFVVRTKELTQITRVFNDSTANGPTRCIIRGEPGVGKTRLALKYACTTKSDYDYVFPILRLPRAALIMASHKYLFRSISSWSGIKMIMLLELHNGFNPPGAGC